MADMDDIIKLLFFQSVLIFGLLLSEIKYTMSDFPPDYGENEFFQEDTSFPTFSQLGQLAGLSIDKDGKLHMFHRANRAWDENTFDERNNVIDKSPIANNTIVVIDPMTGAELYSWGSNLFSIPHGIFIDSEGNTWITDCGFHQVLKFPAHENKPSLSIGKKYENGHGPEHLCKPTDVIVDSKHIFVSDGYCNSRIMVYNMKGKPIQEIGASDGMKVVHSLTMIPEKSAICAADRENRRILCYSSELNGDLLAGKLLGEIEEPSLGTVYAIRKKGQNIFALSNGDIVFHTGKPSDVIVYDITTGKHVASFQPNQGFIYPHCLAISLDGSSVFVGEADVNWRRRLYKFRF